MIVSFDIETDGLLHELTTIHCITATDARTGKHYAFNAGMYADGSFAPHDGSVEDGVRWLMEQDGLAGHKIIWFDIPAIKKLHPWFAPPKRIVDTLVWSNVVWTNLGDKDHAAISKGTLPFDFQKQGLVRKHSLKAWGVRLGEMKDDFDPKNYTNPATGEPHTWASIGFTSDMDKYARRDPVVALRLLEKIQSKNYPVECLELETRVSQIIFRQHERGFAFSTERAEALTRTLKVRQAELNDQLQELFPPWYMPDCKKGSCEFTPKRDNKKMGYMAGCTMSKIKLVVFNPGSGDHIANRLGKMRGWQPSQFGNDGKASVTEEILESLPWPEARSLAEYMTVEKRLGQIAEGKEAWLKHATTKGIYGTDAGSVHRVHGVINTNGAVTGRMTHSKPNVAQTPKADDTVPYGKECRECYIASPGLVLIGCDAEGIELRMMAHYMFKWDRGAYAEAVANGKKEDGTDAHSINKRALGFNSRDKAKTWFYAFVYGAGDYKLGLITLEDFTDEQKAKFYAKNDTKRKRSAGIKRLGRKRRERILEGVPALGKLVKAVKKAAKRGYLKGLDGRRLHVRAEHSALNTLLQSGGAVVMKRALVMFEDAVAEPLRSTGATVEYVANVHDEFQIESEEAYAEQIGKGASESIRLAGEFYKLDCPLAGSYGVGEDWSTTH